MAGQQQDGKRYVKVPNQSGEDMGENRNAGIPQDECSIRPIEIRMNQLLYSRHIDGAIIRQRMVAVD